MDADLDDLVLEEEPQHRTTTSEGELLNLRMRDDSYTAFVRGIPRTVELDAARAVMLNYGPFTQFSRFDIDEYEYGVVVSYLSHIHAQNAVRGLDRQKPWGEAHGPHPLRVKLGKRGSTGAVTQDGTPLEQTLLTVDRALTVLNAFAPLQWSNTIDRFSIYRKCNPKVEGREASGTSTSTACSGASGAASLAAMKLDPEQLAQLKDDIAAYARTGKPWIPTLLDGTVPAAALVESAEVEEEEQEAEEEGQQEGWEGAAAEAAAAGPSSSSGRALPTRPPAVEPVESAAEAEGLARQEAIYASFMCRTGTVDDTGLAARKGLHVLAATRGLRPKALQLRPPMATPLKHKPAKMSRPCCFVRQTLTVHNDNGTAVQSAAAGGCSCRHRDDGLSVPTAQPVLLQHLGIHRPITLRGVTGLVGPPVALPDDDALLLPLSQQASQSPASQEAEAAHPTAAHAPAALEGSETASDVSLPLPDAAAAVAVLPLPPRKVVKKMRRRAAKTKPPSWTAADISKGLPLKYAAADAFHVTLDRVRLWINRSAVPLPPPAAAVAQAYAAHTAAMAAADMDDAVFDAAQPLQQQQQVHQVVHHVPPSTSTVQLHTRVPATAMSSATRQHSVAAVAAAASESAACTSGEPAAAAAAAVALASAFPAAAHGSEVSEEDMASALGW